MNVEDTIARAFAHLTADERMDLGERLVEQHRDGNYLPFRACLGAFLSGGPIESTFRRRKLRDWVRMAVANDEAQVVADELSDAFPWSAVKKALTFAIADPDSVTTVHVSPPDPRRKAAD